MVLLPLDPFLNELTSMFERTTEKGSVWVTLKRSSLKSKVQRNKLATAGEAIEYRCLIRATDGKKTISTSNVRKDALESYCQVLGILDLGLGPIERLNRELVVTRVIRGRGVRGNRHGCLLQSLLGDYSLVGALALVGQKDHQRFQASYATILKAHMTALKKRERKDKKKSAEADKREGSSKKPKKS